MKDKILGYFVGFLFVLIFSFLYFGLTSQNLGKRTIEVTIFKKLENRYSDGPIHINMPIIVCNPNNKNEKYFLNNINSDHLMKYDSEEIYKKLEVGKIYKLTIIGYRIFGKIPNILSIDEEL